MIPALGEALGLNERHCFKKKKKKTEKQRRTIPVIDLGNPQAHAQIFSGHIHTYEKKRIF